jgi:hypothetical protein
MIVIIASVWGMHKFYVGSEMEALREGIVI